MHHMKVNHTGDLYHSLLLIHRLKITGYDLDCVRETSVEIVLILAGVTLVV